MPDPVLRVLVGGSVDSGRLPLIRSLAASAHRVDRHVVVMDLEDEIRNHGSAPADVVVLLVDGSAGIRARDRRDAAVASLLGVRHLVLAVHATDGFESGEFDAIGEAFADLLPRLQFDRVTHIPVSRDGDAVLAGGAGIPWYSGPLLIEALASVVADRVEVAGGESGATVADGLESWVVWLDETPLFRGRAYLLMLGTRSVVATVIDIATRLDPETLSEVGVRELGLDEIGRVSISLSQPVVCDPCDGGSAPGRFLLIDRSSRGIVGVGMVTGVKARNANIVWHQLDVDKRSRALVKGQRPAALWFTGLSGAGKSTIANLVERRLHALGHHTMILDGDNVRHGLNRDLGFSEADRVENIRRIAEVSRLFVEAGLIVLVSFISPYRAERMLARDRVGENEFLEIFVDTPVEECRRRDPKGLYLKADTGLIPNFTGVSAPYEAPLNPEIRLRTLEAPAEDLADTVVAALRARGMIG